MNSKRRTILRSHGAVLTAAVLFAGLLAGLFAAPAATQAGPAYQSQTPRTVTIAAGQSLTMKVRGFCLEFGKPFPTGETTANGLGDNNVRGALNYALGKGYTDSNAQQVQLALWYLRDNTWHEDSHIIAQEIVDNANAGTPGSGTGTSLTDAVAAGTLTASATFVPQTANAFYGDGDLVIKNTSNADVNVYLPIGTVFRAGTTGEFQDLLAYELTASQTGTPGATTTAVATSTITETAVATGTVAVETSTPAAAATTAVETPTAMATATTAALPTAQPTATAVTGSGVLPQTGGGGGTLPALALLAGIGIVLLSLGLAVRSRRRA